jgi:hypothetical protein
MLCRPGGLLRPPLQTWTQEGKDEHEYEKLSPKSQSPNAEWDFDHDE